MLVISIVLEAAAAIVAVLAAADGSAISSWRAAVDEDGHYCFAVAL
jgi:hypothetical protein